MGYRKLHYTVAGHGIHAACVRMRFQSIGSTPIERNQIRMGPASVLAQNDDKWKGVYTTLNKTEKDHEARRE